MVVLQQTPRAVIAEPPSLTTVPPQTADIVVIELTEAVVTTPKPGINVISSPLAVPSLFTATSLKWYGVPAISPLILLLTAVAVDPEPADNVAVDDP
jgi:hypothetical protein